MEFVLYFEEASACFVGVGLGDECIDVAEVPARQALGLCDEFFVVFGHIGMSVLLFVFVPPAASKRRSALFGGFLNFAGGKPKIKNYE